MRTIGWAVAVAVLLSACTQTEQTQLLSQYEKKKHYHKQLLKTEKVQLYDGNLTKIALTATYLSDSNRTDDERFVIGLYVEDDDQHGNDVYDFNLTLNGKAPNDVQPLAHTDGVLKDISFVSNWNHFFLVTFPHVPNDRLTLVFESKKYGRGELYFARKAKYVFTKQAF